MSEGSTSTPGWLKAIGLLGESAPGFGIRRRGQVSHTGALARTAPDPQPQDPGQNTGIAGTYTLVQINNSKPGQLVTIANPDGTVIGLYRFDAATQLNLDALQTFDMNLKFTDDKSQFELSDEGEFKQAGSAGGSLALTFTSATYDDAFSAIATDGVVAINYDLDGDGQADTVFAFQRVAG